MRLKRARVNRTQCAEMRSDLPSKRPGTSGKIYAAVSLDVGVLGKNSDQGYQGRCRTLTDDSVLKEFGELADDFALSNASRSEDIRAFYFTILTATGLGALTGSGPTTGSPPTDRM